MIRNRLKFADFRWFAPLRNHVPDLHYNVQTNMAVIVNKAYFLNLLSLPFNPVFSLL